MIFTARQLEDLHKSNGHVTLPYGARLTPLAVDWARSRKVAVGYTNIEMPVGAKAITTTAHASTAPAAPILWWCDGPCGAAKAAITALAKETPLAPIEIPADRKQTVPAIKHLAATIKAGKAGGGVLLVDTGAAAVVFSNRCPSLRAILGTSLQAVEQGVQLVAANVLVIEYPRLTLMQVRNLLARFVRAPRDVSEDVKRQLEELASCG